jgi:uncharacterized protein YbjT (DUF2867 family)
LAKRILIAGASGSVGYELLQQAREAGHWVRAQARSTTHYGKLARYANDVVLADVANPLTLAGITREVDVVVSCLGAPVSLSHPEKRSFHHIDYMGNRSLLEQAVETGIERFVYVSVHLAPGYTHTAYVQAHEAFVDKLQLAKMPHTIVRPTGIFSALVDMLAYARFGFVPTIGDGQAKTNPIHEAEVARACLESVEGGPQSIDCGGPDVYTRREVAELMFKVMDKTPFVFRMPPALFRASGWLGSIGSERKRELYEFFGAVAQTNCVAPEVGRMRLEDYLRGHILR